MGSVTKLFLGIGWAGLATLGCAVDDGSSASGHTAVSSGAAVDPSVAGGKDNDSVPLVFDSRAESAGLHCAAGGMAFFSGPDKNRNGKLDSGEVTITRYVCNG